MAVDDSGRVFTRTHRLATENQKKITAYFDRYLARPKALGFALPSFEHCKWLGDANNTWNHEHEGLRREENEAREQLTRKAALYQSLVGKKVERRFGKHGVWVGTIDEVRVGHKPNKCNEVAVVVVLSYLDPNDPSEVVDLDSILDGTCGPFIADSEVVIVLGGRAENADEDKFRIDLTDPVDSEDDEAAQEGGGSKLTLPAGQVTTSKATDLHCLHNDLMLTDSVVVHKLKALVDVDLSTGPTKKYVVDSLTLLRWSIHGATQSGRRRSCSQLFEHNIIFVPVCHATHWSLVVICNVSVNGGDKPAAGALVPAEKKCTFIHFDSCNSNSHRQFVHDMVHGKNAGVAGSFLQSEWASLHPRGEPLPRAFHSNAIRVVRPNVTQQKDSVSCGLFVLEYAEQFIRNWVHLDDVREDRVAHEDTKMSVEFDGGYDQWLTTTRLALTEFIGKIQDY
jgi:hypothetical protein